MKGKNNIATPDFKEKYLGKVGIKKRDTLEEGYENFKIGSLINEVRLEKRKIQDQLAEKVDTTKSYI